MKRFKNLFLALSLIILFNLTTPLKAHPQQVLHVPGDYATIGAALNAAASGDTVQVAAGTYIESGLGVPSGVTLAGAGWQTTTIDGNGMGDSVLSPQDGSTVEGFTIRGSGPDYFDSGVWISQGTVTLRNNRITGNAAGLWAWCFDADTCAINITLKDNLIVGNNRSGVSANEYPVFTLRNNTVADNGADGVTLNHANSRVENTLIVGNANTGLANNGGATAHHNDVWGNGQDYAGGGPGSDDLSHDPFFRDAAGGDYRLRAGSPAIGTGTPAGTDMGALPFTPVGTMPAGLSATAVDTFTWQLAWTGNGAAGYTVYLGTASGLYTRYFDAGSGTGYTLSHLPGGLTYYAAVSAHNAAGDESAVSAPVSFDIPAAPTGYYEEDNAAVALNGDWTVVTDDNASGGTYARSTTAGDTVQFSFSGDSVALYRGLATDGGRATVIIDNISYGTLEFAFNETRWQVPALYDGLGAGVHALTLRVTTDGQPVTVDAFAVPHPHPPTAEQDAALSRVNWHRQIAGIPPVRQDGALNRAAQVHAEYAIVYQEAHHETPGNAGFIGEWPTERGAYFGYSGGVGEDMHGIGEPVGAVDGWMETVYHRNLIMGYGAADMGYGLADNGNSRADVLNMAARDWNGPAPDTRFIYTYPADGQTDVPYLWGGGEAPDPLPGVPKPVGYPVSLYIAQPRTQQASTPLTDPQLHAPQALAWAVSLAELRDASGALVPSYLLHQDTDPNGMGADVVFLIAHDPLDLGATYTAHIAGSDSRDQPFDHTWTFSTQVAASIQGVSAEAGACGAQVSWHTAGEATTTIEYGLTDTYGQQAPGESVASTAHGATLADLGAVTLSYQRVLKHQRSP